MAAKRSIHPIEQQTLKTSVETVREEYLKSSMLHFYVTKIDITCAAQLQNVSVLQSSKIFCDVRCIRAAVILQNAL